jgi:predicted MPP superfamily phosphohydrolase
MRGRRRRLVGGILLLALGALGWACGVEPARLVVRRQGLVNAGLPPMRVALLSDLHAGGRFIDREKIRHIVDVVNAERPDLTLLLGDYLNNGPTPSSRNLLKGGFLPPEPVAEELGRLRAHVGVYAVLGNHDWWFDGARITAALERQGITVLENRGIEVRVGDHGLWLIGLAESLTRAPDLVGPFRNAPPATPILALTHNPDLFPSIPERVALTVAGHTHGGQVALPLLGRPIVPSRFGQRYAAGLVEERGHQLFVTTGLGTSLLPVRFRVPPEVVILTVIPGTAPEKAVEVGPWVSP